MGYNTGRNHKSCWYAGPVQVTEQRPPLNFRPLRCAVDMNSTHQGQVEDDAIIAGRKAWKAMPTAPHREQCALLRGDGHGFLYIRDTARPHNGTGEAIGGRVPNPPMFVIFTMPRIKDFSFEVRAVQVT